MKKMGDGYGKLGIPIPHAAEILENGRPRGMRDHVLRRWHKYWPHEKAAVNHGSEHLKMGKFSGSARATW